MESIITNNKRIAKNTVFLYIRMFVTIVVSLYTSRVVLDVLGVNDFGIYNIVGGVVTMFSIITNSMTSASQRFLAFELGKNKEIFKLKSTFNTIFIIYVLFAVIIILLGETVGLWFVSNKLNIQPERMEAAIWVYQLSLLSFLITILRTPYNAAIIAHEKMKFYAWISIIEAILKLSAVLMLVMFNFDKLILYAVFMCTVIFIITSMYVFFCFAKFPETRFNRYWDKDSFKAILSFSGWSLFDSIANVASQSIFRDGNQCCSRNCFSSKFANNSICRKYPNSRSTSNNKILCRRRKRANEKTLFSKFEAFFFSYVHYRTANFHRNGTTTSVVVSRSTGSYGSIYTTCNY